MRPLLANLSSQVSSRGVFERRELGAAAVCVERAGELSRTAASNSKSVCSISQELLFPLLKMTEYKRYLIDTNEVTTA